jgi:hypothetical protein
VYGSGAVIANGAGSVTVNVELHVVVYGKHELVYVNVTSVLPPH